MTAPAARSRCASWLAMLAVVLLAWAGVRSTVMQAQMVEPGASCADMPGMRSGVAPARPGKSAPARPARCEYCAAAAHAPLGTAIVRLDPPVATAVFARYEAPASLGPRGPPHRSPTARGPPALLSA